MAQASKLHEALDGLMKENEALTLKAALANTFKVGAHCLDFVHGDMVQHGTACHSYTWWNC